MGGFVESMPDLNQQNPHLMKYLTQNSIWWIEYSGIDGIRMDTKMLAGFGGQEYSTYYSLLGNISYLEAVGNEDKATVTLQLKNKNVNALKQIVDFIKQFAGM